MKDLQLVRGPARGSEKTKNSHDDANWLQRSRELIAGLEHERLRVALTDAFEERAAIACFDGGLSRGEAEKLAFDELVAELLKDP
ncbi:MAG: hypothetical protein RLN76_08820 [Phycisphaeraceae bacterium]